MSGQESSRKNGVKLKLQEQPFRVLCMLVERPGEVVTREEVRERLWPVDTFVDFDHGVNAAIKRLRDALGDSPDNPRFVETLQRRGYRFIGPVDTSPNGNAHELPKTRPSLTRWTLALPLAVVAVALAIGASILLHKPAYFWPTAIESLVVLPLENLSHDPEQEYFSDGMTEALITQLSKLGTWRVVSRTSTMRYKGTHKSLPEIARELNVDAVIEGSVMRSGNRVRITAQLIRARTDQHLWAETYDRDLGDVLRLQSDVAQAVAQRVQMQLTPGQQARLRSTPAVDSQAYEAYLKGRSYLPAGTEASITQAQAYFDEAVRRDPSFALAYVGLAESYMDLGMFRWLAPQEAFQHGNEAIRKALQLDEALGEAHSALGFLQWQYSWNWQAAERELRYAVDLNPNFIEGHQGLVWYLAWSGRRDEALAEIRKMRWLDRAYPLASIDESGVYYHQRDYRSLIDAGRLSVTTSPNMWVTHYFLAVGYEGSGQLAQAVPEYQRAVELSQRDSDTTAGLAHLYAKMGRIAEADRTLGELQRQSKVAYVSPYVIAAIYSGFDQKDKAFEFLERAYQERSPDLAYFAKADLRIDGLRSDPRFRDLLRRVGFTQ